MIAPDGDARITDDARSLSPEEMWRTIHELRAHQVELEQQNEALRKDNERLQAAQRVAGVGSLDWDVPTNDIHDLIERKPAEEELHNAQALLAAVVDSTSDLIWSVDPESFGLLSFNRSISDYFLEHRGIELQVGMRPEDMVPAERFVTTWHGLYRRALAEGPYATDYSGIAGPVEMHLTLGLLRRDGKVFGISVFGKDITERRRAEDERAKLQAQLQQAQKMESVGRLAGGVAHDFNNMLGVILGHTEMAMEQVDPAHALHADLEEVHKAATRSVGLTRQLLAFARKQTIVPRVLDLNDIVAQALTMLGRLVGEDIHVAWQPGADLWPVKVDPSQIDQILTNLLVNARDAITGVGKVTIETANATIDAEYCAHHADVVPGEYVRLVVSDSGCGMDKETQAHLFEPFFTTKALGKGTGLGLATVYGIVKQNQGFINVYTEPGRGTTFTIALPRYQGQAKFAHAAGAAAPTLRGSETILLVEDEPAFLKLTATMLARQGYAVLTASTPGEGIRVATNHPSQIHLLMTDVVMPEMNGRDLATHLLALHPKIEPLFMSGYTANVIAHHGVLEEGVSFIQKPFSVSDLAAKVRETLDREHREQEQDS